MTLTTPRIAPLALARLLSAVLMTLAYATTYAAPPQWYRVEIIVFANLDTSSAGDENWPLEPGTPALDNAVELLDASGPEAGQPELRLAYQQLTGKALQLAAVWRRLRRSSTYRPLLHIAWRQPGLARDEAHPVHLRSHAVASARKSQGVPATALTVEPAPPEIDGTLRLYRARYLHLDADLRYHPGLSATDPEQQASVFRLTESRRVRSRKLYYFDHPWFGLLALVTPAPEPEPQPQIAPDSQSAPDADAPPAAQPVTAPADVATEQVQSDPAPP